jgi:hypothetical protein
MRRFDDDRTLAVQIEAKNHAVEVIESHRSLAALARHWKEHQCNLGGKPARADKLAPATQASHGFGVKSSEPIAGSKPSTPVSPHFFRSRPLDTPFDRPVRRAGQKIRKRLFRATNQEKSLLRASS